MHICLLEAQEWRAGIRDAEGGADRLGMRARKAIHGVAGLAASDAVPPGHIPILRALVAGQTVTTAVLHARIGDRSGMSSAEEGRMVRRQGHGVCRKVWDRIRRHEAAEEAGAGVLGQAQRAAQAGDRGDAATLLL